MDLRNAIMREEFIYRTFRKYVINVVLATDIASPERTQVGKSKWKEAFGDPFETIERKLRVSKHLNFALESVQNSGEPSNLSIPESSDDPELSLSITPESSEAGESLEEQSEERRPAQHLFRTSSVAERHKLERRMSAASCNTSGHSTRFRQRLGILRTVDLSGETLETYSRRGSASTVGNMGMSEGSYVDFPEIDDEPDELKMTVVMETLMTAADVAHNLQSFRHMVRTNSWIADENLRCLEQVLWSGRLYLELRRAYVANRGPDPQEKWFENQIGFLESYLLPLARRLEVSAHNLCS